MDIIDKIKQIQCLLPSPDDIIVITVSSGITCEEANHILTTIKDILKKKNYNNEVLMIANDVKLSLIRKEDSND